MTDHEARKDDLVRKIASTKKKKKKKKRKMGRTRTEVLMASRSTPLTSYTRGVGASKASARRSM